MCVPIVFGVLTLASSIIQWQGVYSLLPTVGSLLAIVGFWFNNPRTVKLINLPAVALWLVYSIITGSISTTIINAISITTIIISLAVDFIRTYKTIKYVEYTNKAKAEKEEKDNMSKMTNLSDSNTTEKV